MATLQDNWIVIAIVIVAVIAALVFLWGIWWLWWRLPQRQVAQLALKIRDPKARADVEDNFRKTIGQLVVGIAVVLIGGTFTYLQFLQQQRQSLLQAESSRQQSALQAQFANSMVISSQVARGFEQLATDRVVIRIGGIFALEGAMNASEAYREPLLEALCAFVRGGTQYQNGTELKIAEDIQVALTVIGRRSEGSSERLDLSFANLANANLSAANLRGIKLTGAKLFGARLDHAHLEGADLSRADLYGADLFFAKLEGADLRDAKLRRANLNGAHLDGAHLGGTDLSGAILFGVHLDGQEQLDNACGGPKSLPSDFTPPKPCPEAPVAPPLNPKATP